jgi:hypothetical protein
MNKWISSAALFTLFLPLMVTLMDLFAYRRGVVHPLLSARDPSKMPAKTLFAFWDMGQVKAEYKFLKELTCDPLAQTAAASLSRRIMLIIGLAVPIAGFLVLNLFQ